MDSAPLLKFVSIKVDDLQYSVEHFKELFELSDDDFLDIASEENSDKNATHDTTELFNIEGGASLQLVQIDSENTINPQPNLLQIGIIGIKIKSRDILKSFFHYRDLNIQQATAVRVNPLYHKHFHLITQDFLFQIKEDKNNFFGHLNKNNGGVKGVILGVSNIEKSKEFYQKVLGYNKIIFEGEKKFEDYLGIEGGDNIFKRVILEQTRPAKNIFSNFFGKNQIELLQVIDNETYKDEFENIVNPYRLGYFSVDNRDIIGNYIELGYDFEAMANEKYIQITDPDGVIISCNETTKHQKNSFINDLRIFTKTTKQKI